MDIITDAAGYLNKAPNGPFSAAKLSALLYLASRQSVCDTMYPMVDEIYTFDGNTIKGSKSWAILQGTVTPSKNFLCLSSHNRYILEHIAASCGHLDEDALARHLTTLPEVKTNPAAITFQSILIGLNQPNAETIAEEYASLMRAQDFLKSL